ncbi:hypothetical protein RFI_23656, partial [Reticulomyxa filosa]
MVPHKHELLICGGYKERNCYSYHTLKNEYKFICSYPNDVNLNGHCVVKLVDNNKNKDSNEITLLSFGGYYKHTLIMKYVSVWSNDDNNDNKSYICNQWIPFTDNHNNPIMIGSDYMQGARALIGGSNNHLLFITYTFKNICVFDLNKFQFIKYHTLPTYNNICYHCFVLKPENGQETIEINEENKIKKKCEMLLFYNNTFEFYKLRVCDDIAIFGCYAYVHINNTILFFGGRSLTGKSLVISNELHKYLIQEKTWSTLEITLPNVLRYCSAILSEDNTYIHMIEENIGKDTVTTHMKIKVNELSDPLQL